MTQAEVAGQFDVTSFTVFNWEKGYTEPHISHIPGLIKFLGYDPTNHNSNSISEQLLCRRRELGWTQKIAARNLGVDPCTWSSWECGGTIMTHKHRRLVASFLNINEKIVIENDEKAVE